MDDCNSFTFLFYFDYAVLIVHWKDWCWTWNSNTLATWCKEPTHWKRLWCWERLKVGGEGDDRGSDGWMASPAQWMWVWVNSGSWCWTGKLGVLQSMGLQRVRHDWVTELNWTDGSAGKESACNAGETGDAGSVPGWGRSPEEGNSNPLQYSYLENRVDRGDWQSIVQRVRKSWSQLSD